MKVVFQQTLQSVSPQPPHISLMCTPCPLNMLSMDTIAGIYIADSVVYDEVIVFQLFKRPLIAPPLITYHFCPSSHMVDDLRITLECSSISNIHRPHPPFSPDMCSFPYCKKKQHLYVHILNLIVQE